VTPEITTYRRCKAHLDIVLSDSKHPLQYQGALSDHCSCQNCYTWGASGACQCAREKSEAVSSRSPVSSVAPEPSWSCSNMPTTTLTMTPTVSPTPYIPFKLATESANEKSLPASLPVPPHQLTATTLRPLYTRAVRAFLHRDIVLTHSLLTSAFSLITPPLTPALDSLTEYRRKWDVLRITLEVTIYTTPPPDSASIPTALRSNALLSAAALLATLHTRSLRLFAPADGPTTPNPAFLPAQVLVTLALSSAKIGCPAAGRGIIEEWLACRASNPPVANAAVVTAEDGYEKVLEVYTLNILPALGEWAYARQFLGYETELPVQSREVRNHGRQRGSPRLLICSQRLTTSLASLQEQQLASLIREPSPSLSAPTSPSTPSNPSLTLASAHRSSSTSTSAAVTPTPSRPSSPTPSNSSTSTTSTHTAVPTNPHPHASKSKPGGRSNGHAYAHGLAPLTPTPSSTALRPSTHDSPSLPASSSRAQQQPRDAQSPARRSDGETQSSTAERRPTSWYVLTRVTTTMPGSSRASSSSTSLIQSIHTALRPYIRYAPLFLLCVVLPALAVLLRFLRHRRRWPKSMSPSSSAAVVAAAAAATAMGSGSGAAARKRAVDDVRRRLSSVQGRQGLLSTLWNEAVRAVWDTVAMGGRGLV
jgi:hypothetical protein